MARATKTVETGDYTVGKNLTFTSVLAADGIKYDNVDQTARIVVNNTTAGAIVVTISTDKLFSPQQTALVSKTYSVPANAVGFVIDPLQNQWWAQQDTTDIFVDVASDGLDMAVVKPAA